MLCGQGRLWKVLKVVCRREYGVESEIYTHAGRRDSLAEHGVNIYVVNIYV